MRWMDVQRIKKKVWSPLCESMDMKHLIQLDGNFQKCHVVLIEVLSGELEREHQIIHSLLVAMIKIKFAPKTGLEARW